MKNQDIKAYKEAAEPNQTEFLKKIWNTYSFHWPLFLISITLCLIAAVIYVQNAIPEYIVQAKISINASKNEQTDAKAALEKLDILQSPKVIESEVAIIKSRPLIRRVVDQLELWQNYQVPVHFTHKDIYHETPVLFRAIGPQMPLEKSRIIDIIIKSEEEFELKAVDGTSAMLPFNKPLRNSFGRWRLDISSTIKNYIGKAIRIKIDDPESVVTNYQQSINVNLDRNAPLVELQLNDEVAKRGEDVLNHLIGAYKFTNVDFKNQETARTLKFIDERLSSLTKELSGAEKMVENYKSSIGLTDISSQSQLYLNNIQANDSKLNEVNIQLNVIQEIENYVNSSTHSTVPATIGISDPGLVSLVEQLTNLELNKMKRLATTPEDNPVFVPLLSQIASTKVALKNKIRSIKSSLEATKKQLRSNSSNFESSIKSIPGQERQYLSFKRQQGIKENLYVYLLQKREEIALSYASTLTDARTVEDAFYELSPVSYKFPVAIALLCGLMLPAGFISMRKAFKNRILTKSDIEVQVSAPVISELIFTKKQDNILVLNGKNYAISEQLRLLRTSLLQVASPVSGGKVTLFTSSKAGEGKSFVASNIGASLAASGKRTILLELDLRRPKLSKIFKLDDMLPGISEYITGKVTIQDIIRPSGVHPNLFIIKCGAIPSNPSELLQNSRMELMINRLKLDFDNILIDSPPMRLVTDAAILAPLCHVCLYIVRHNFTNKSELEYIEEVYRSEKLKNMQIVFNSIEMDERFGYTMDWGYYSDQSLERKQSVFGNFAHRF